MKTDNKRMNCAKISDQEKHCRNLTLEEDYVHQVYEKIGKDLVYAKHPLEDTVKNFLDELEPGSLVADIGCGDGRYLRNGISFCLGADNSSLQASLAHQHCQEVMLADNLRLPFRRDAFDAVLSVAVIHHLTTRERRIKALKELTRILKIGGRVFIAVKQQNMQKSQDVLIPWFSGQKYKTKDKYWLDQDTNVEEQEYTDDDDDSISLSSSEDDDVSLNFSKLVPLHSHFHSKQGFTSDSQAYKFAFDCQTSSNNVPNSEQIVQVNTCYTFVQKALKKLSSANNTEEAPYLESDLCRRNNSVFSSPLNNEHKQKVDFLNGSSSDFDVSIQNAINDNFIELLNIDDERPLPLHKTQYSSMKQPHQSSRTSSNKRTPVRSLSDMFKNINSSFSKNAMHSCSDLKDLVIQSDNDCKSGEKLRRLVRSKTTATCNPEFDYCSILDDIEELDMTISEATKIINDFLESSVPPVQKVKFNYNTLDQTLTSLSQSDIVNGNNLQFLKDSEISTEIEEKIQLEDMKSLDETNSEAYEEHSKNQSNIVLPYSANDINLSKKIKNDTSSSLSSNSYKLKTSADLCVESTSKIISECSFSRYSSNTNKSKNFDFRFHNQNNFPTDDSYLSSNILNSKNENIKFVEKNTDYMLFQQKSPSKIQKMAQNYTYQLAGSKSLGPFYDEDNYGYEGQNYSSLSSYYSMPELHALSDFYLEYNLYQNSLHRTSEFDETYPMKKLQDLPAAQMSHNIKLAKNTNILKTNNFIQLHSKNNFMDNTFDDKLYKECIKKDLDNSNNTDSKVSSLVEKQDLKHLCNKNASNGIIIHGEKESFSLVSDSNAKLNPTEFFNLNNKCQSLITIDSVNYIDETGKSTVTTHSKISKSHSTGGMFNGLCKKNHGSLSEIPINQHYFQSSCLNLNELKQIYKNTYSSSSSNEILNNRLVEAYLQNNDTLLEKVICNRYNECAFYNKNEDLVTSSLRSPNVMKTFSYCNLNEPKNIQFKHALYINDELSEKYSSKNDQLCMDSETSLHPLQRTKVLTISKKNYNSDKSKFSLLQSLTTELKPRNNRKECNNNEDFNCQVFNSSLLNPQDASENNALEEGLCNSFKSNKSAICSTNFSSKRDSQSINNHVYVNLSKGCDLTGNVSDLEKREIMDLGIESNPEYKIEESMLSLDSSHFLSKNISENKLGGSIIHQKEFSKSDIQNGATTTVNSEIPTQFNANSFTLRNDFVSTVTNPVGNSAHSKDSVPQHFNEQQNITDTDRSHMDFKETSYRENVNYTYGHVLEEGAIVVSHRYHHLFQKEELEEIIENNVKELHILHSFQCESHWCIIAEKVRLWTI